MEQYIQPEDVAGQMIELNKILEKSYDPYEEPQMQETPSNIIK